MAERDLREIAAIQHGFFRADQARASGLSYRYLARARERGTHELVDTTIAWRSGGAARAS